MMKVVPPLHAIRSKFHLGGSRNSRSTMIHRSGIPSLPISNPQAARPFSSQVRHDASPIGMNLSSASRTPNGRPARMNEEHGDRRDDDVCFKHISISLQILVVLLTWSDSNVHGISQL